MSALDDLAAAVAALDVTARSLVSDAARSGDFEAVSALTPIAKEIAALASRWAGPDGQRGPENAGLAASDGEARGDVEIHRETSGKTNRYPHYLLDRGDLVKVGWSPRDRAPYEHRVSRESLDRIVRAIAAKAKAGRRFQMADVIEAVAPGKGDEGLPSYQVYAAVSWLKWHGLLLQHGRQGYTVVRPQTFVGSVETAWQSLTRR